MKNKSFIINELVKMNGTWFIILVEVKIQRRFLLTYYVSDNFRKTGLIRTEIFSEIDYILRNSNIMLLCNIC